MESNPRLIFLIDGQLRKKANSQYRVPPRISNRVGVSMQHLGPFLAVQICLAFGMAGLLWPDKFMPLFHVLMFPWAATYRGVRANSIAAIALSFLLFLMLMARF